MLRVSNKRIRESGSMGRPGFQTLTALSDRIKQLGNRPAPNIGQQYNKAADLGVGAATQSANQGAASFMANEGNRGGVGASLFSAGVRQQQLAPAMAQASQTRAQGAEAQFGAERQQEQDYLAAVAQLNQLWTQELQRREENRRQKEAAQLAANQANRDSMGRLLHESGQPAWAVNGPYAGRLAANYTTVPYHANSGMFNRQYR